MKETIFSNVQQKFRLFEVSYPKNCAFGDKFERIKHSFGYSICWVELTRDLDTWSTFYTENAFWI